MRQVQSRTTRNQGPKKNKRKKMEVKEKEEWD